MTKIATTQILLGDHVTGSPHANDQTHCSNSERMTRTPTAWQHGRGLARPRSGIFASPR